MTTNQITVSLQGTKALQDIQKLELRRLHGSTFELTIVHPTGAVEKLLADTSGKLDRLTITKAQDGGTLVYISGAGVRRERR